MNKFKVGDRVEHKGYGRGTIKGVDPHDTSIPYAVEFDDLSRAHTCGGLCKGGHGLWCREEYLELIKENLKELLKPGYIVRCRDNNLRLVMPKLGNELILVKLDYKKDVINWTDLTRYSTELLHVAANVWDIIEIYGYSEYACDVLNLETDSRGLIWKREEDKKEMTIAEIEKELGYGVKIVKESEEN